MQNLMALRETEAGADEERPSKRARALRRTATSDDLGPAIDFRTFTQDNHPNEASDEPHVTAYIKTEEQVDEELGTMEVVQAPIDREGTPITTKAQKNSVPAMRDCKPSMMAGWNWPRVSTDVITEDQGLALDYLVTLFNRDPYDIILSAMDKHDSLRKVYTRRSKTMNELGLISSHTAARAVRSSLSLNRRGPPAKWKKHRYIMDVFRFSSWLVSLQQAPTTADDTFTRHLQRFNLVRYHHPKLDRLRAEHVNEIDASQQQYDEELNNQGLVPKRDYDSLKARFDRLQESHNSLLREMAGLQRRFHPSTSSGGSAFERFTAETFC